MKAIKPGLERQTFNLIEVVLALVIILVGVVSIMALFPVSQKATSAAIGQNSAGDAGDQFLRYYSSKIKTHWALANALPLSKPSADAEANARWETIDGNGIFTGVKGVILSYNDEDGDAQYDYTGAARDESGLFKLVQRTSGNIEDFSGILRVWRTAATYSSYERTENNWTAHKPVPPDQGVVLNVEVSWPAELPYDRREKASYTTNVFRPSENPMEEVNGAFAINQSGNLRFTYHGSDAAWVSSFWMQKPTTQQIFDSNQTTDQAKTIEVDYDAGEEFNFYIEVENPSLGLYKHYAWAAIPPECLCKFRNLSGVLNTNPSNSSNNEITLYLNDRVMVDRSMLKKDAEVDAEGTFYRGPITKIEVRPKGFGNQNTILVNDVAYTMENDVKHTLYGELTVRVYNDYIDGGKSMGDWWFVIENGTGQITAEGEEHDKLCPLHPDNKRHLIVNDIPLFDNPPESYDGASDLISGNPYCLVTDMEPGRKWLLRFEDMTGSSSGIDWDYNDVVLTVELLVDDGVSESVQGVPVAGTVDLDPNGDLGDNRLSLTKADGTFMSDADLAGGYDGKAISLWFRPGGSGTQTITVDGADYTFDNSQMVSISATDMNVKIWKEGGSWKASFDAANADFTVLD